MDKVTVYGPEHFAPRPDAPEAFGWLGCGEDTPCHAVFREAWPEAVRLLRADAGPRAATAEHGDLLTVFLTLGPEPEKRVDSLFERQAYVLASLLNTLCDQMLFQMNHTFSEMLRRELNAEGRYMADRLEPGAGFRPEAQRLRFAPLREAFPEARISGSGILTPAKSMMYCVRISGHVCDQTMLHDCSKCSQKNCLYRKI